MERHKYINSRQRAYRTGVLEAQC